MNLPQINSYELPSITEWLEKIKAPDANEFREEDIKKFERLAILKKIIGLDYDAPTCLSVEDIVKKTNPVKRILETRGNEICTMKIIPLDPSLPKLRIINKTLKYCINTWFPQQIFDWAQYKVEILKHNNRMLYSSNFLINDFGIWGDIIKGAHWQLTTGIYEKSPLTFYSTDFHKWTYYTNENSFPELDQYIKILLNVLGLLKITDPVKRNLLKNTLKAEFNSSNFLKGYFEFFAWPQQRITFNDYNRIVYLKLKNLKPYISDSIIEMKGIGANPGVVESIARIIIDPKKQTINPGDIIVCKMINLDFLPLLKNSGGIVAEQGNILSHITIISRELRKPCIVNVKDATSKLKDGDLIIVDANQGLIQIRNR